MTIDTELQAWMERRGTVPAEHVRRRLERERHREAHYRRVEGTPGRPVPNVRAVVRAGIAASGLSRRGLRNARDVRAVRRTLTLAGLPVAFEGLRVLQIADPHFGADPGIDAAIHARAAASEHDLCVLTGDYRHRSFGPIDTALAHLARLRETIDGEMIAVLGNHDAIGMAPSIEAMGIELLINECRTLRRGGAALHVVGVDDPHDYRLDDLGRALAARPAPHHPDEAAATLVLAHSPEIAEEAAAAGCAAYLCGHTHGGQVCLPGGVPLMRNARAPGERLSGSWRLGGMHGYTSRGAGVSIAEARFWCPPEITLHVLGGTSGERPTG